MVSCVPPAGPYNENNRSQSAAFVFSTIDWEKSRDNNLIYREEDFALWDLQMLQTSALLFDIKMVDLRD
jgi:hypothetical protein